MYVYIVCIVFLKEKMTSSIREKEKEDKEPKIKQKKKICKEFYV